MGEHKLGWELPPPAAFSVGGRQAVRALWVQGQWELNLGGPFLLTAR